MDALFLVVAGGIAFAGELKASKEYRYVCLEMGASQYRRSGFAYECLSPAGNWVEAYSTFGWYLAAGLVLAAGIVVATIAARGARPQR